MTPHNLCYTREHEWLTAEGDIRTVGITSYAAQALGDIVYVQLPKVGDQVEMGKPCGEIESTKSVSDLYAPADGEVVRINHAIIDDPAVLSSDPYGAGWLFELRVNAIPREVLTADHYTALISTEHGEGGDPR